MNIKIYRALHFNALSTLVNFLLNFGSVIAISRLLKPEEIGIFSVAVSFSAFAHVLREFGVGQYFVQLRDLTKESLRLGFTVMLISSWTIAIILLLVSHPLADFYGHNGLISLFQIISINFAIIPFGSHILSVLKRELKFGYLAITGVISTLIQVAVTITSAWNGESYLSMVWGTLAGNIATMLLLFFIRPDLAGITPKFRGIGKVFSFGAKSSTASLLNLLGSSGPDIIFGKTLGFEAVALFSRASSLNNMVLSKVVSIFDQVYLPAFAQSIRDGNLPKNSYLRSIILITSITFPLITILSIISHDLIITLFGDQWVKAADLAPYLCIFQLFSAPVAMAYSSLVAGGHIDSIVKAQFIIQSTQLVIVSCSLFLSLSEIVYLLVTLKLVELYAYGLMLRKHYSINFHDLLTALNMNYYLIPGAAILPLIYIYISKLEQFDLNVLLQIFIQCLLATIGYLSTLIIVKHPLINELIRYFPKLAKWLPDIKINKKS